MVNSTDPLFSSFALLSRVTLSMMLVSSFLRALSHPFRFLASFVCIIYSALPGGGQYMIGFHLMGSALLVIVE
jgi:hypothetical protein